MLGAITSIVGVVCCYRGRRGRRRRRGGQDEYKTLEESDDLGEHLPNHQSIIKNADTKLASHRTAASNHDEAPPAAAAGTSASAAAAVAPNNQADVHSATNSSPATLTVRIKADYQNF